MAGFLVWTTPEMKSTIAATVTLALALGAFPRPLRPQTSVPPSLPEHERAPEPSLEALVPVVTPTASAPPTLAEMEPEQVAESAPPEQVAESAPREPLLSVDLPTLEQLESSGKLIRTVFTQNEAKVRSAELEAPSFQSLDETVQALRDEQLQIDGDAGSIRVGDALGLDFGFADSSYDETAGSYDLLPGEAGGFSNSLLQLSWSQTLAPGASLVGTMAATRFQDVTLWEALAEPELAWVSVGVHFSF